MGILRALWDHRASDADSRLILHITDFSLVQSLWVRPASFSSEVTEWLHETVRMLLSPSVSLVHTGPTPVLQGAYTSADLGMHLASASAQTGLSPLSSIPPELVTKHGLVASFSTHALAECFPIGALRDSWTWRDLFTGEPLLIPLEERVSPLLLVDSSDSHQSNSLVHTSPTLVFQGRRPQRTWACIWRAPRSRRVSLLSRPSLRSW